MACTSSGNDTSTILGCIQDVCKQAEALIKDLKAAQDSTGFFGRLFGKKQSEPKPADYRIALQSSGTQTLVSVQSTDGKPLQTDDARKILQILQQQIL